MLKALNPQDIPIAEFLTPKEFASLKNLCPGTARSIFNALEFDPDAIERVGTPSPKFPKGKLLRMRKAYFEKHYSASSSIKQST